MYESYYRLSGKPFQLSPDPHFFFGSRGHRRAMAYLEYGLHQAEGFIVVTGEVGAGKTTLVQQMLRRLPANNVLAVQVVTTQLEAEDLVRVVASSFGLNSESADKSTLLIRLEHCLRKLHDEGRRALLVIDEAQNLGARAIEELRMLSNFQIGTKAILQSFLIGQPELRDLMQRPEMRQLKQRIIAACHLGPLDRAETQQYVEHRLRLVGWKNDPAFDDAAFDCLFAFTHGIPRRINSLSDRLLLSGFLSEKHVVQAADVEEVAAELRMELGPRPALATVLNTRVATPGTTGAIHAECEDASNGFDGIQAPEAANSSRLESLEGRVALLESTTGMIFGTLKKVLRLLRGGLSKQDERRLPQGEREREAS